MYYRRPMVLSEISEIFDIPIEDILNTKFGIYEIEE